MDTPSVCMDALTLLIPQSEPTNDSMRLVGGGGGGGVNFCRCVEIISVRL